MSRASNEILGLWWSAAVALAVAVLLASASHAGKPSTHAVAAIDGEDPRIEADLLFDSATVAAGENLRAGVRLRMDPDWHVYWKNSGDAGFPTEIDWSSSEATFAPLQYPVPEVFIESGGLATTYGYSGEVLLVTDVTVAQDVSDFVRVRANARFLVCKVQCIPGEVQLDATLPVEAISNPAGPAIVASFDRVAARIPKQPGELGIGVRTNFSVTSIQPGEKFELSIAIEPCLTRSEACPTTVAFAEPPGEIAIDAPESLELDRVGTLPESSDGPGFLLVLRGRVLRGQAVPDKVSGVLSLLVDGRPVGVDVSVEFPRSTEFVESQSLKRKEAAGPIGDFDDRGVTLWVALAFGILGGLILNLMPCVLPVLALKAYRIIEAGGSEPRELRSEGLAFTSGVLLSMAALASLVLVLRSAGQAVGWGFQFQQPGFLAFMAALLTVFALNLFGVFEITIAPNSISGVGSRSTATLRSFFDGTLAVLLATPCSAPFLGTAVGFAFAGTAVTVVLVFLAIGFGLALPYFAMSFVPGLASRLPRPGAWMEDVRSLLGFALLATVVWLLWIAGSSVGAGGVVWFVSLLLGIGLIAWVYGRAQNATSQRSGRLLAAFSLTLVVATIGGIRLLPINTEFSNTSTAEAGVLKWHSSDVRRVVESGRPAFVDFTADWCLSCKVNERMVLSRPEIAEAMRRFDVAHFRADWTLRNEEIFAELQSHGRAGVPLYLVYRGGSPDAPEILPEILTVDRVVAALQRASRADERLASLPPD